MAPKELLKTSDGSGMPYQLWNRVSSKNVTFSCQIRPLTSRTLKLSFWNSLQTIWYCIYIWLWLLLLHRPDSPYDPLIEYVCSPQKELSFKKPSLGSSGFSTFSTQAYLAFLRVTLLHHTGIASFTNGKILNQQKRLYLILLWNSHYWATCFIVVVCSQTCMISEECLYILDYLHSYNDVSLPPIFPTAAACTQLMTRTAFVRL